MQKTQPPEPLALEAATQKCSYEINKVLKVCTDNTKTPEPSLEGFEKMAEYARSPHERI